MTSTVQELDSRENDGITVSLLWSPPTNELTVHVYDASVGAGFDLAASPAEAVEIFHHPFAYAAARGVGFAETLATA